MTTNWMQWNNFMPFFFPRINLYWISPHLEMTSANVICWLMCGNSIIYKLIFSCSKTSQFCFQIRSSVGTSILSTVVSSNLSVVIYDKYDNALSVIRLSIDVLINKLREIILKVNMVLFLSKKSCFFFIYVVI